MDDIVNKLVPAQIVDEALAVIRSDGEVALSMRSLATKLGVTPMALYHHFADRDALLLALVERVSETIAFPVPSHDPVRDSVDLALCLHGFLVEHPWMIRLISTGRLASPAGLRFPEGFLSCARHAGLDDEAAFVFYRTMFATILGQATITCAKRDRPSVLPEHDGARALLPVVTELAPRWQELDAAQTPARVFEAVAGILSAA
ncbi:TetR/AcrR family transcriptional regulator [Corynebacterium macclintockiae]